VIEESDGYFSLSTHWRDRAGQVFNPACPASRDTLSRVPSRPALLLFFLSRPVPGRDGTGRDAGHPVSRQSLMQIETWTNFTLRQKKVYIIMQKKDTFTNYNIGSERTIHHRKGFSPRIIAKWNNIGHKKHYNTLRKSRSRITDSFNHGPDFSST